MADIPRPFLSVVTRCYRRPKALLANITSLARQTDPDYEQLFIVDEVGRGIAWANAQLYEYRNEVSGDWIHILDDDDRLCRDDAVEILRREARTGPDLVVFRADHGPLGVLPDDVVWRRQPVFGHIGSCDFIVRRQLWQHYVQWFDQEQGGDYAFLQALWPRLASIVWCDVVLAAVQRISRGQPE